MGGRIAVTVLAMWGVLVGGVGAQGAPEPAHTTAPTGVWDMTLGAPLGGQVWSLTFEGQGPRLVASIQMGQLGGGTFHRVIHAGDRLRLEIPVDLHGHGATLVLDGRLRDGRYEGEVTGLPGHEPVRFRARPKQN